MTTAETFRAEMLRDGDAALAELTGRPCVAVLDQLACQLDELAKIRPRLAAELLDEEPQWAWYPWRQTVVRTLGPRGFDACGWTGIATS